jgi:hypothetical protein
MLVANRQSFLALALLLVPTWMGCTPGYQSPAELDRAKLGPGHCAKSCYELGMRMAALVLVESAAAGCVCEPLQGPPPPPVGYPPAPPPGAPPPQHSSLGATGVAAGFVVIKARQAAAVAAASYHPPIVPVVSH